MRSNSFDQILVEYENALYPVERYPSHVENWLQILQIRDSLELAQNNKKLLKTPTSLAKLIELDNKFKHIISKQKPSDVSLFSWQSSIKPASNAWWWSLDQIQKKSGGSNIEWLWGFLIAACFVISLGLILDVMPKLLLDGPDLLGAIAIIFQSFLVALSAGGTFTSMGKEILDGMLQKANIPFRFWQAAKLCFATTILIVLFIFRLSLPNLAIFYNNYGLSQYEVGNLSSAEQNFLRAIKMNPGYKEAHYNLGLVYEDIHDYAKARAEYNLALLGRLDAANNNLGRLYILDKDYDAAISVLLPGLITTDKEIRYDLLKNLGWARLMQGRYEEASTYLLEAKTLAPEKAPAHCLLAQIFYKNNLPTEEIESWSYCLMYATNQNVDEDTWLNLARQRMQELGVIK
jgi:tetratricopeptide (TPR) repeat protein